MNNSNTESPNRKRFRDENPSSLTSPEQNSNKRRRKKKNKNKGQDAPILQDPLPSTNFNEKGAEQNEQLHLCPNPNAVTLEKEQGAEPNGVITEPSVSDSTSVKRKKKRKRKKNVAVAYYDREQPNSLQVETEVRAVQPQVCHKYELANPVVQEKENFVQVKEITVEQPQNKQEHEFVNKVVEQRKETGVGKNEGVADAEHPQVCPKTESACPVHTVIPMEPEVPIDPEQKLSKKKKKKKKKSSALNNEVAEPDKHNNELPEIPVQGSICPLAAPQTDQKIPTDSATPIDQEQKSKKKKQKKKKIALKSDGSESVKHNAYSTAGIPVNDGNVDQPANAPLRRSKRLKQKEALRHMSCMSSQKIGHRTKHCPDANSKKICFFCRKFGHSLSNCSVSQAGGQFAWCLFCYSHGHFTKNCPRNGIGIDPKVVVANGPAHKTVEA